MHLKYLTIALLAAVFSLGVAVSPVQAAENRSGIKDQLQAAREAFKAEREAWEGKRCELVTDNIAARVGRYDTNVNAHKENYQRMQDKAQELVNKAKLAGLNTTELETALQNLTTDITTFNQKADTFIAALRDTQSFVCGNSEGKFLTELKEARAAHEEMRKAASEVRATYQSEVRPAIKKLSESYRNQAQ